MACPQPARSLSGVSVGRYRLAPIVTVLLACLLCASPLFAQKRKAPRSLTEAERQKYCASLSESKRRQTDICKTEEERAEDARQQHLKEQAEKEKPTRTSFLQRMHLDGLWIPTSTGVGQYGLIGTHLDVASIGRVHLFGPPGMMMVLERAEDGGWRVRPELTWGVSLYLSDVRFPGSKHHAQLFFNLTKAWSATNFQTGRDMAGLSLSWKK